MEFDLSPQEVRVIGCLMEKAVTTPDQYPLTLNALTSACNQKSSRDPVMQLEPGEVLHSLRQLEARYMVSAKEGARTGVEKYSQRLCNTTMAKLQFPPAEFALITLLLLRGAQTPGELRSRSARLYGFADNGEVVATLGRLMDWQGGPLVARLPRRPGRQDHEYVHLFSGEVESVPVDAGVAETTARAPSRLDELEARVEALEHKLRSLAEQLGEEI